MKEKIRHFFKIIYRFFPFKPFLENSWEGKIPLWKVFWLAYFTPRVLSIIFFGVFMVLGSIYWPGILQEVMSVYITLAILIFAWGWHVLWRNSRNTPHPVYTYIVRILVTIEFIGVLYLAY